MLAPYQGQGTPGPMIVDQAGNLVWFHPLPAGQQATNLGVQEYEGRPVLTWWQGRILQLGFGEGEDVLYDSSYRLVATVRAGNGYQADLHEIRLTPQGTAWIDAFYPIHMNLSSVHGARAGVLNDSVVQEIDVKTGLVMWEWHALGHISAGESNNPPPPLSYPWDYAHVNSIDPGADGDVLLSARNTWALYDVDIHSGGRALAPRRRAQQLQAGSRSPLLLAARRGVPARRPHLAVRQRLGSARRRSSPAAWCWRPTWPPTASRWRAVRQPDRERCSPQARATRWRLPGGGLAARLRPPAELHRVRLRRPRRCSTARSAATSRTSRRRCRAGAASRRRRPPSRRCPAGPARDGCRELERRDGRRRLARARR